MHLNRVLAVQLLSLTASVSAAHADSALSPTGAAVEDLRKLHPEAVQGGDGSMVSASNRSFYDAHKAQIRQHNQAIAHQQLQANGGKLPACLK